MYWVPTNVTPSPLQPTHNNMHHNALHCLHMNDVATIIAAHAQGVTSALMQCIIIYVSCESIAALSLRSKMCKHIYWI